MRRTPTTAQEVEGFEQAIDDVIERNGYAIQMISTEKGEFVYTVGLTLKGMSEIIVNDNRGGAAAPALISEAVDALAIGDAEVGVIFESERLMCAGKMQRLRMKLKRMPIEDAWPLMPSAAKRFDKAMLKHYGVLELDFGDLQNRLKDDTLH